MKEYQVYLFDMDGTLVNSEPLKGKALSLTCGDYCSDVDFNIYKTVMGESWSVVTGHFFKHANISPDLVEFNRHFRVHYEALLADNITLIKGAKSYIENLNRLNKRCAVVSSAANWMVDNILNALGLCDAFEVVITQEDVSKHKPDPEAYNLALEKLKVSSENALIFEDSNAGVLAGKASGCDVIAINHEFNGNNDLSGALKSIDSYDEIN
jgi:HAD superfamily hydrolase (TIGR01509 family)